jgi:hypothetical protein
MRNVIHITDFRLWREQCGFTITQAGKAVGLTKQMASFLDRGWNGRHAPCQPRQATRKLMMAAVLGLNLEPWTPTKAKEKRPRGAQTRWGLKIEAACYQQVANRAGRDRRDRQLSGDDNACKRMYVKP